MKPEEIKQYEAIVAATHKLIRIITEKKRGWHSAFSVEIEKLKEALK